MKKQAIDFALAIAKKYFEPSLLEQTEQLEDLVFARMKEAPIRMWQDIRAAMKPIAEIMFCPSLTIENDFGLNAGEIRILRAMHCGLVISSPLGLEPVSEEAWNQEI